MSRLVEAKATRVVPLARPFSNFRYVEKWFQGSYPIRRLFSQARARDCKTLVIEDVPADGAVDAENKEILALWPDHQMRGLHRLSFWRPAFTGAEDLPSMSNADCFGYAILKRDLCPTRSTDRWTVFEAVLSKYEHEHNYMPSGKPFEFRAGAKTFGVLGALYCQQNGLNKACAQVALRSICATYLADADLSYDRINTLAFQHQPDFTPWAGLTTAQLPLVLQGLSIPFFDFDYKANPQPLRDAFPYQRVLYSGVEAGAGGLVVFSMSGPGATNIGHVVPVFGHTFNADTWAPHAEVDYFNIGNSIRYVPSDAWMTNFIVHDDNYGSDLCIPKAFLNRQNAEYAVALLPSAYQYNGLFAEFTAADYFYSLLPEILPAGNAWLGRLVSYCARQKLILRTVAITRAEYIAHLSSLRDWEYNSETQASLDALANIKADRMWMIEVSIPDLFSTNLRKIGELLLDAGRPFTARIDFSLFVLARFPEVYFFFDKLQSDGRPGFVTVPSALKSHTRLLRTTRANVNAAAEAAESIA